MREFLEFEQVWALRDYEGFIGDVKAKFPPAGRSPAAPAITTGPAATREVATAWFQNMESAKFDMSLISDDVIWDNIPPTPGISDVAPWRSKPSRSSAGLPPWSK
jgi:hypothetical protein